MKPKHRNAITTDLFPVLSLWADDSGYESTVIIDTLRYSNIVEYHQWLMCAVFLILAPNKITPGTLLVNKNGSLIQTMK